ncbi:hypothetical protein [Labrys sp. 22185]|uniref:hypothetical protein n=1 Tax=Labrys sp. 22185 TaxID=3453888 RepID=UPI003F82C99B
MSCVVVANEIVDIVISAAIDAGLEARLDGTVPQRVTVDNATTFGRALVAENVRSVLALYPYLPAGQVQELQGRASRYAFTYVAGVRPEALPRLVEFLDYHSCETDAYKSSAACDFYRCVALHWIINGREDRIGVFKTLPWGIASKAERQLFVGTVQ